MNFHFLTSPLFYASEKGMDTSIFFTDPLSLPEEVSSEDKKVVIKALWEKGYDNKQIQKLTNLSRQRVHQITQELGLEPRTKIIHKLEELGRAGELANKTIAEIAKDLGCSTGNVKKFLTKNPYAYKHKGVGAYEKYTKKDAIKIAKLRKQGMKYKDIANKLKLGEWYIPSRILKKFKLDNN
jgi:DNA-binding NarL/FixJ family response regulator